jgi:hypothetical protein
MNISNIYTANSNYSSASDHAKTGLSRAFDQFEKSAVEIAKNTNETTGAGFGKVDALIDQLAIDNHVKANALTLQADSERIGTLIDLQA